MGVSFFFLSINTITFRISSELIRGYEYSWHFDNAFVNYRWFGRESKLIFNFFLSNDRDLGAGKPPESSGERPENADRQNN